MHQALSYKLFTTGRRKSIIPRPSSIHTSYHLVPPIKPLTDRIFSSKNNFLANRRNKITDPRNMTCIVDSAATSSMVLLFYTPNYLVKNETTNSLKSNLIRPRYNRDNEI